jgi:putative ABC transport system permease protein
MTRGFALVSENPTADIWVMDPTVNSVEQTINVAGSTLARVRSVAGVRFAAPLLVGVADVRFPNGRFQPFQIFGVDDQTLAGLPTVKGALGTFALRSPDAVLVAPGGTSDKLETPKRKVDQWPQDGPHLNVPTRQLAPGDELQINDERVVVKGIAGALPRFPPRPLLYTTLSNASRILLPERHRLTFVLVTVASGVSPHEVATRIETQTGMRARTADDFKADTVRWFLKNSEDVGDVTAMLLMAITVGFGVTGVMLYMFTSENLKQYAVLKAMGTSSHTLLSMIFAQAGLCALIGTGLGLGICGIAGQIAVTFFDFPFRLMWFAPLFGLTMVVLISLVAAAVSVNPVLKLDPATVFAGR